MNLAELSIKKRVVTWVITIVILVGGVQAFNKLGRLEDPLFTIKEALVITQYPGATAMQVAEEVSNKLEMAIQQLPEIDYVESTNSYGISIISVHIKDKYAKDELRQIWDELRRKVNDIQYQMPLGANPSIVNDQFGDVYGILLSVTADGYSYAELKEVVDKLRRELVLVNNVGKVSIWGEQEEAIYVEVARAKMAKLGVGMDVVINALKLQNKVSYAGSVKVGRDFVKINPTGNIVTIDDINNIKVLDHASGRLFKLSDVATVTKGYQEPFDHLLRFNGKQALSIGISNVAGSSVVELGAVIKTRLAELEANMPIGFEINYINFQPDDVSTAVDGFVVNFIEAIVIVFVVLLLFMGMRSGLIIGVILTLTVLATFLVMDIWGINLQRISLGALVIALGMLVDNAIVITEGMLIQIQQGKDRLVAAKNVTAQNLMPLLGATVIAILAFAAVGASKNSAGEFTSSLFYVMLISLFLSWVLAITITPLFAHDYLKRSNKMEENVDPYAGFVFTTYKLILTFCLRFRWLTVVAMLLLLVTALYGFMQLKGSFFPPSTRSQFLLHYYLPEGADVRATSSDLQKIEQHLLDDKRVVATSTFVGKAAPRFMLTFNPDTTPTKSYGMILIEVNDSAVIDNMSAELTEYLSHTFPDAEPKIKKFVVGPPTDAMVEVRFSGPDPKTLRQLSEQAQQIFRESPIATSIRDNWRHKVKEIRPQYSVVDASLAGVSKPDFNVALEIATTGLPSGYFREKDKLIPIITRYPLEDRADVNNLNNMQVFSSSIRQSVSISQVAPVIKTQWTDALVQTRDRKLTITASCEPILGMLASEVMEIIKPQIEAMELPSGYEMHWGGEYEGSVDAQKAMAKNMPPAFLAMLFILILLFNSIRLPIVIFLTVPFAVIGVSLGLSIAGLSFSFMALLGFLSLVGMVIKNGIVLVDQIVANLEEGIMPYEAVMHASVSRMRPVMMAAITTVLGMLPLVSDAFFGSMAVTIMGGLSFATLLTLIAVPVFYSIAFAVKPTKKDY